MGYSMKALKNQLNLEIGKRRGNFRCIGRTLEVEAQLSNLASITQVVDPKLHKHIEHIGGGDYVFAFRMLMVLFRQEFYKMHNLVSLFCFVQFLSPYFEK
ncbi:unnamed protein product [Trifolium pratense]|uniref:Uncharacterized protein n=1 Tax=Trifolium pratense TaxID=57577 RepID=A0ACB0ITM6_TRIPR|nr:unnamed protein product [Trifolium pratense]